MTPDLARLVDEINRLMVDYQRQTRLVPWPESSIILAAEKLAAAVPALVAAIERAHHRTAPDRCAPLCSACLILEDYAALAALRAGGREGAG